MHTIKIILMLSLMVFLSFSVYGQDWQDEVRQHYEKGKQYYEQGRYKQAQEEFQKALTLISQEEKKPSYPEKATEEKVLEYTIGKEDVLDISVWGWEDLHSEVIVRPDGKISFPLVGDVQTEGKTLTELDKELTERLKEYIRAPEVSIMLRKFGGKKVIVLGEVRSPGVYRARGRNTIMEVIALAGGFTEDAVLSSVILIRGGLRHPRARRINLAKLNLRRVIDKGDLSENISVQPEDLVYVPKKFIANINYFLEQIIEPVLDKTDFFKAWESTW